VRLRRGLAGGNELGVRCNAERRRSLSGSGMLTSINEDVTPLTHEGAPMKMIFALAAVVFLSSRAVTTPASAQKDPACMEKCNRDNKAAGGGRQVRGTGPAAKAKAK
jgi:hypothetical protein